MRGWNRPASSAASSYADASSDGSPAGKRRKTDQDEPIPEVVKGIMKRFPYCDLAEGVMVSYHYQNITLGEPPRKLYTYRGEVSFETDKGSTAFHGTFATYIYPSYVLEFTFHWRGDRRHMKRTVVYGDRKARGGKPRIFAGEDSSRRTINIIENGSAVWCNTCECWHWDGD